MRPVDAAPPRQVRRPPVPVLGHVDLGQRRPHPFQPFGRGHSLDLQRITDVAGNVHVRPQGVGLEHHSDPPFLRRDVHMPVRHCFAVEPDCSRLRSLESRDEAKERRLPASGGSEQRKEIAFRDVERHAVDGGADAEPPGHLLEAQPCHGTTP